MLMSAVVTAMSGVRPVVVIACVAVFVSMSLGHGVGMLV